MKICVIGCGAVGSLFAAHLAKAGEAEVWAYDFWKDHVDAIQKSAVCSVQNGVGNEELIAEHVRYVIRGTTFPAGHPVTPGHIGYDIKGDTWIGPFEPTDTAMSRVEELAGFLTRAGMNTIPLK